MRSTSIYPILNHSNPLRTSTDSELTSILNFAKEQLGLKTIVTLMLDPDWTLPHQQFCRGHVDGKKCFWRGQLGMFWSRTDCSQKGQWGRWFEGYTAALVHYAKLSAAAHADAFLLSHELQTAVSVCPGLWNAATAQVRSVFSGQLSHAFQPNLFDSKAAALVAKISHNLDWIGVDCYLKYPVGTPPSLPWQDLSQAAITSGVSKMMSDFAQLSKTLGGKPIVCTEVGWSSRPWTYTGRAGMPKLDPGDCSVWDQCVSNHAQALMYEAFFENYYAQPWFGGVLFWLWRADPTAGGTSDDGFSVWGKPAAGVIAKHWL